MIWGHLTKGCGQTSAALNTFVMNKKCRCLTPDYCHVLKNLKHAKLLLKVTFIYLNFLLESLYLNTADGKYICTNGRQKYHLKRKNFYLDNPDKMNVGDAMRFFPDKTAAALETAVHLKLLPEDALIIVNSHN